MPVSFVAGTQPTEVTSTTVAANSPAGLADDDGLFAFVRVAASTTCTGPAGWTEVTSVTATRPTGTIKFFAFRKDTVTSADSSTSFTFTAGTSTVLTLYYAAVRSSTGTITSVTSATSFDNNYNPSGFLTVVPPAITSTLDDSLVVAVGAYTYEDEGTFGAGALDMIPSGMTGWTTLAVNSYVGGAHQVRDNGQAVSTGTFRWAVEAYTGITARAGISLLVEGEYIPVPEHEDAISDRIFVSDVAAYTLATVEVEASAYTLTDTAAGVRGKAASMSDSIDVIHTDTRLGDTPNTYWLYALKADYGATQTDTIETGDTIAVHPRWGYVQADTVEMSQSQAATGRYNLFLDDDLDVTPLLRVAVPVIVTEGVSLTVAVRAINALTVIEQLAVDGIVTPTMTYTLALVQDLTVSDTLARFFGATASDAVTLTETAAGTYIGHATTAESLTIAETVGHVLILSVTVADGVDITPTEALQMLYSPVLTETVSISAAYVHPSGAITTWAVNTRTAATTEYTGYAFNSFAQMGLRYLAASSDGLYALDGDTDDAADIIASIKTGLAQFAGSRFTAVKGIYLGLRATGEFALKIVDAAGTERTYQVLVDGRRTAKVQVGKGIRTRYLSFELVSTGQDFDLDTIEVVPLVEVRRV